MNTRTPDFKLAQVEATLRLEDMTLDVPARALLAKVAAGQVTYDQARAELLARHRSDGRRRSPGE